MRGGGTLFGSVGGGLGGRGGSGMRRPKTAPPDEGPKVHGSQKSRWLVSRLVFGFIKADLCKYSPDRNCRLWLETYMSTCEARISRNDAIEFLLDSAATETGIDKHISSNETLCTFSVKRLRLIQMQFVWLMREIDLCLRLSFNGLCFIHNKKMTCGDPRSSWYLPLACRTSRDEAPTHGT